MYEKIDILVVDYIEESKNLSKSSQGLITLGIGSEFTNQAFKLSKRENDKKLVGLLSDDENKSHFSDIVVEKSLSYGVPHGIDDLLDPSYITKHNLSYFDVLASIITHINEKKGAIQVGNKANTSLDTNHILRTCLVFALQYSRLKLHLTDDFLISARSFVSILNQSNSDFSLELSPTKIDHYTQVQLNQLFNLIERCKNLSLRTNDLQRLSLGNWNHLYSILDKNERLKYLDLSKTSLAKAIKDDAKFEIFLKILQLPQIKFIKLIDNDFNKLPKDKKARLEKAFQQSTIEMIDSNWSNDKIFPAKGTLFSEEMSGRHKNTKETPSSRHCVIL